MAYAFSFEPVNFNKSLEDIRVRFPLIREAIYINKEDDSIDFVQRLEELDEADIEKFASSLKSNELDLPLSVFKSEIQEGHTGKLDSILKIRFRKKLFLINWLILQNNYTNQNLISSMLNLCGVMKEKFPEDFSETIFFKIPDWNTDIIGKVCHLLIKEKSTIDAFFDKYQLLPKSKFSYDFFVEYFKKANKENILNNWEPFLRTVRSYVAEQSACVCDIYLKTFEGKKYSNDVTDHILQTYGNISEDSLFWDNITDEGRDKFRQWSTLKTMEKHFGKDSKKYNFWADYFQELVKIERYEEQKLIFIYFASCVVVDMGNQDKNAYLYYRESFDVEYAHFINTPPDEEKKWRIFSKHVIDARDSVLEEKSSDIYKMNYEFVGKLYIREILQTEAVRKRKNKQHENI